MIGNRGNRGNIRNRGTVWNKKTIWNRCNKGIYNRRNRRNVRTIDRDIKRLLLDMINISMSMDEHRKYMDLYYEEFEENMGFIKTIKVIFKKIINLFKK